MDKITPDKIDFLKSNEIFVFESNLSGFHGTETSIQAIKWGAITGKGSGLYGFTYAIPTKGFNICKPLSFKEIAFNVNSFIEFAKQNPELIFLVTEFQNTTENIFPLFKECLFLENVKLPVSLIYELF